MPQSRTRRSAWAGIVLFMLGPPTLAVALGLESSSDVIVRTLAGTGFCATTARPDPSSSAVGSMAVDADGRIFFDAGRPDAGLIVRVNADGRTDRLKTGPPAQVPADSPAGTAGRLAADGKGGVFVADSSRLIHIDAGNGLTVIPGEHAGGSEADKRGSSGDEGPAVQARFTSISSIASDEANNIYIADRVGADKNAYRIRFINRGTKPVAFYPGTRQEITVAPGSIDTVAGRPPAAVPGSGSGPRVAELLGDSPAMAVAPGILYLDQYSPPFSGARGQSRVRVINFTGQTVTAHGVSVASGAIETVAQGRPGGPKQAPSPPARGGPADFGYLPGIAIDSVGNLVLADQERNRVLMVDPAGRLSNFAGTGSAGDSGDYGPAARARLSKPFDVKAGLDGRVYISDAGNGRVRVVDQAGGIHPAPGNGVGISWRCAPAKVGSDRAEPAPSASVVSQSGGPAGVAADARGNIYFSLTFAHQIKRLDTSGKISTVAGALGQDRSCSFAQTCPGFGGDGGPAVRARLAFPTAVALSPGDNLLYALDNGNARIRVINLSTKPVMAHGLKVGPGAIQTVAGNGKQGLSGDGGSALSAELGALSSEALLSLKGLLQSPFFQGMSPEFSLGALAADAHGNLFIAEGGFFTYGGLAVDTGSHRVRQVNASGVIATLAGRGAAPALVDCCMDPTGLALGSAGELFVSDRGAPPVEPVIDSTLAANTESARHPRLWVINRSSVPMSAYGQAVAPRGAAVVAGNGSYGFGGDGGPALWAQILTPSGIALDSKGRLFLAEFGNSEAGDVRVVDPGGTITRVLGNGQAGFNGDWLKGGLTSLHFPTGLALDRCGGLLVADFANDRVRLASSGGLCRPSAPIVKPGRKIGLPIFGVVAVALGGVALAAAIAAIRRRGL